MDTCGRDIMLDSVDIFICLINELLIMAVKKESDINCILIDFVKSHLTVLIMIKHCLYTKEYDTMKNIIFY